MDAHWIPQEPGHSLYIRPTLSAPDPAPDRLLGLRMSGFGQSARKQLLGWAHHPPLCSLLFARPWAHTIKGALNLSSY